MVECPFNIAFLWFSQSKKRRELLRLEIVWSDILLLHKIIKESDAICIVFKRHIT